jgi:Leucine-rich repeat (LRR) protein
MNPHVNDEDGSSNVNIDSSFEVVNDWAMVDDQQQQHEYAKGDWKGLMYIASQQKLTSEYTPDADRWIFMPSLLQQPSLSHVSVSSSLRVLDLYKNRYLKELHPSVCDLSSLEVLSLRRCENLVGLPENIGNLKRLQTLDLMDASCISSLPDSLGDLTR